MTKTYISYVRVSKEKQNHDRQFDSLKNWAEKNNVTFRREFVDIYTACSDDTRPMLEEMLLFLREGDTLVIHSIDRLVRSMVMFGKVLEHIKKNKIDLIIVSQNIHYKSNPETQTESIFCEFMLNQWVAMAQMEVDFMKARQREAYESMRVRGVKMGPKLKITGEMISTILEMNKEGKSLGQIAKFLNISRTSVVRYLKKYSPEG